MPKGSDGSNTSRIHPSNLVMNASAASETFTESLGMSHCGWFRKNGKLASAGFNVSGDGNTIPKADLHQPLRGGCSWLNLKISGGVVMPELGGPFVWCYTFASNATHLKSSPYFTLVVAHVLQEDVFIAQFIKEKSYERWTR